MKKTEEKIATPDRGKTNNSNPTSSQKSRKENPGQIQKNPIPGPNKNIPPQEWQSGKPTEHPPKEGKQDTDRTDVEDEEDEENEFAL